MITFQKQGARVEVWHDLDELSARAAQLFIATAYDSITGDGDFTVALSGGSTPRALYARLASEAREEYAAWARTHVFWSDERCVPPTDEQSNYRMARETLLDHVPLPPQQVHRMRGEDEPASAAAAYTSQLGQHLAARSGRFNLILLGMGDEGHTASLFPHSPTLDDHEHLVAAPFVEKLKVHRLTLTLRVINDAANIIFLVSGESKAAALHAVLEGDADPHAWPARMVQPTRGGKLTWLIDQDAATQLSF
jgi:6-phosphogluconolactonase